MKVAEYLWPEWAVWVLAFGPVATSAVTAIIGIAVGIVAYRQWRAAREKLVLELFDRRFKIYELAKTGVDLVTRAGNSNNDGPACIASAFRESRFLFGDEVVSYLDDIFKAMINLGFAHTQLAAGNTEQDWPRMIHDRTMEINAFYERFPNLTAPYMRLTQKIGKAKAPRDLIG